VDEAAKWKKNVHFWFKVNKNVLNNGYGRDMSYWDAIIKAGLGAELEKRTISKVLGKIGTLISDIR